MKDRFYFVAYKEPGFPWQIDDRTFHYKYVAVRAARKIRTQVSHSGKLFDVKILIYELCREEEISW